MTGLTSYNKIYISLSPLKDVNPTYSQTRRSDMSQIYHTLSSENQMLLRRLKSKPLSLYAHSLPHRAPSHASRSLHQQWQRLLSTSNPSKPANSHNQHQEIPIAKFSELGASRTVKIVVIVALTIGGTMETIFWTKVIWRKFFGGEEEKVEEENS